MYKFTRISGNKKTGLIPVTISGSDTCPDNCPLKAGGGCYANQWPLVNHWKDTDKTGVSIDDLCSDIKSLPRNQLWRHNSAGDLPGKNNMINKEQLFKIVRANRGKKGFTYTHKPTNKRNIEIIKQANNSGFIISLSANNPDHADKLVKHGLPVVTILKKDHDKKVTYTANGNKIVTCPASYNDKITCSNCQICAIPDRKYIIGFPAHGHVNKAMKACEL